MNDDADVQAAVENMRTWSDEALRAHAGQQDFAPAAETIAARRILAERYAPRVSREKETIPHVVMREDLSTKPGVMGGTVQFEGVTLRQAPGGPDAKLVRPDDLVAGQMYTVNGDVLSLRSDLWDEPEAVPDILYVYDRVTSTPRPATPEELALHEQRLADINAHFEKTLEALAQRRDQIKRQPEDAKQMRQLIADWHLADLRHAHQMALEHWRVSANIDDDVNMMCELLFVLVRDLMQTAMMAIHPHTSDEQRGVILYKVLGGIVERMTNTGLAPAAPPQQVLKHAQSALLGPDGKPLKKKVIH